METKVKINWKEGIIELEGNEEFVKTYLNEFKGKLFQSHSLTKDMPSTSSGPNYSNNGKKSVPKKTPIDIKDEVFDLSKTDLKPSLKAYLDEKKANSCKEQTLIIAEYIISYITKDEFSEGQILHAYKTVGIPQPVAFHQMFINMKNKNRWITEGSGMYKWKLTLNGHSLVKSLPRTITHASINK